MGTSILVQIALVPLYINVFGQYQFGVLMVLLGIVNFASIGIGWLGGRTLRLLGEYAAHEVEEEFCRAFQLINAIYLGYGLILAVFISIVSVGFDKILFSGATEADIRVVRSTLLILGVYLVFHFVASVGRLALTARKRQGVANLSQLAGIVFCALSTLFWLLGGGNMIGVIICHILGSLVSIFVTRHLLRRNFSVLSFRIPSKKDADLFKRLGGKTGAGFLLHGARWHCYLMPFWSAIWAVQKLLLNSILYIR